MSAGGLPAILAAMAAHVDEAAVQDYGCDALNKLSFTPSNLSRMKSDPSVVAALRAAQAAHPDHANIRKLCVKAFARLV